MPKVMIDPGHGPTSKNKGPTGYYEYKTMWTLSNYLKAELIQNKVEAFLTRTENEDPDLPVRGYRARDCDIFISQHSNAFNGYIRGTEVFHSLRRQDKDHAARLSAAIAKTINHTDRGAKTRSYVTDNMIDYYGVIRAAAATNVKHIFLCESGFHDNAMDEAWLKVDNNLKLLAKAQALVIYDILNIDISNIGKCKDCIEQMKTLESIYNSIKKYNFK